jgi:hypothetical protein
VQRLFGISDEETRSAWHIECANIVWKPLITNQVWRPRRREIWDVQTILEGSDHQSDYGKFGKIRPNYGDYKRELTVTLKGKKGVPQRGSRVTKSIRNCAEIFRNIKTTGLHLFHHRTGRWDLGKEYGGSNIDEK